MLIFNNKSFVFKFSILDKFKSVWSLCILNLHLSFFKASTKFFNSSKVQFLFLESIIFLGVESKFKLYFFKAQFFFQIQTSFSILKTIWNLCSNQRKLIFSNPTKFNFILISNKVQVLRASPSSLSQTKIKFFPNQTKLMQFLKLLLQGNY
jgi:hypothetical protein